MSELSANRSTPLSVEELRSNSVAIAVHERGSPGDRNSDYFNYQCHIFVDADNKLAMKKVSHIAEFQSTRNNLAVFLCKTPSTEALDNLRTIGVSVNFD